MSNKKQEYLDNLKRDVLFIALGFLCAIILIKAGALQSIVQASRGTELLLVFIAGICMTSSITIAIGSVILVEVLGMLLSPLEIAMWSAMGSTLGDLLIYLFVRNTLVKDVRGYMRSSRFKKIAALLDRHSFRWLLAIIGMVIIAAPVPDEYGLALVGLSRLRALYMLPLFYVTSFIEVMLILGVAQFVR